MKSISQMYAEEVKSLPLAKDGRPDPLATSRIKAELQVRFWLPIAEMVDPRDRTSQAGAAAQDFYSRGRLMLRPHEMQQSLVLMKRYLGIPRLTFNTWFQLRPIFRDLLSDALDHADMDLVACAAREFVRLTLGQPKDPRYGQVDLGATLNRPWYDPQFTDDEDWFAFLECESDQALGTSDWKAFMLARTWHKAFDDPVEVEKEFPHAVEHRLNMVRALEPIFDRDWFSPVMEEAFRYAKTLLAINFREVRLALKPADSSALVDAA